MTVLGLAGPKPQRDARCSSSVDVIHASKCKEKMPKKQGKASLSNSPLNDLFHDIVTIILTSRMAVSELDNDDDDDDWPLVVD